MVNASRSIPPVLADLLRCEAPSGHEAPAARIWSDAASSFASLSADRTGSAIASVGSGAPRLALFGHIDEIGLIVSHIDEKGFLWFAPIGAWDPMVLVGQRVHVRGRAGSVLGVIGRTPIHFLVGKDKLNEVPTLDELCIDIGATSEAEAVELVRVGDTVTIAGEAVSVVGDRVISKAIDNRVGAFIVLEALRRCAAAGQPQTG